MPIPNYNLFIKPNILMLGKEPHLMDEGSNPIQVLCLLISLK
ncbi:MAG TPA: hypothetical protein VFY77_04065 [Nitrososphaeraceae archaeon]|nr:hypothetical protein [Nitrososphaeraceae archaeon]